MKRKPDKQLLLDLSPDALKELVTGAGEAAFRAGQIVEWVYRKKVETFDAFTDIPLSLRGLLAERFTLRSLALKDKAASAVDGTVRYNFRTWDGYVISAVFLPEQDRTTICLSSQAGCPVGCVFCETGKLKFRRNLTTGEIVEQILQVEKDTGKRITGVLFMGMGEPFLNLDSLRDAVRCITDYRRLGLGRRHVTVSTVGIVPAVRKYADEQPGVRIALSLHAADDEVRRRLIPSIPFSAAETLKAAVYFSRRNNARLTVEYVLIDDVTDTLTAAKKLIRLTRACLSPRDEVRFNLIPYNPTSGDRYAPSKDETVRRFRNYLERNGLTATVRAARGADIGAACGQLGV